VIANGGSVSATTAKAVDAFCKAIDTAGIRSRFYRLNLFAGTGLNACLVPLYRGPSKSGTQYGNTTDTNVGPFVSGDYVETGTTGGLSSGTNTSKFLRTGIAPSDMSSVCTNVHVSVYSRAVMSNNSPAIGANAFSFFPGYNASRVYFRTNGNSSGIEGVLTTTSGHILGSRTAALASDVYRNGASVSGTPTDNGNTASDTYKLGVFAQLNTSEGASQYFSGTLQMYSLGLGMTAAQAASFYTAVQTFQTSLGRNL
jgi:hypothetical protein